MESDLGMAGLCQSYNDEEKERTIRAADAKEVGVGNPAEETYRYPNQIPRSS
jgi:hypothetical protein